MECSTTFPKSVSLMHLWMVISSRVGSLTFHFVHYIFTSSETLSSYPVFSCQNLWMILLPFKKNGDAKPSGSYTELNLNSIPLFVAGLSFSDIVNPNVSVLMCHTTPNALSFCTSQLSSSLMLMFFLQCSSGVDFITSVLLFINLVELNSPALQVLLIWWIKSAAWPVSLEDSMSSIYIFLSVLAASVPNSFPLSTEVRLKALKIKYHQIDNKHFMIFDWISGISVLPPPES